MSEHMTLLHQGHIAAYHKERVMSEQTPLDFANDEIKRRNEEIAWLRLLFWSVEDDRIEVWRERGHCAVYFSDDWRVFPCTFDASGIPVYSPELAAALKKAIGGV